MKYGRVLTYKDEEEAKKLIGKEVVVCDYLYSIEGYPEERYKYVLEKIKSDVTFPFITTGGNYQFIREVIKGPQIMTNRQLGEWCARGNGLFTRTNSDFVCTDYRYRKSGPTELVPDDIRILPWDSDEWVLPTVDIYERDCIGGK